MKTYHELTESDYEEAFDNEKVLFQGWDWSDGNRIVYQLCHRDNFPETTNPAFGFDNDGFFVRAVPTIAWPKEARDWYKEGGAE